MSEEIDRIFYINLAKRTDRKEQIENELNRMCLTNYERYDAHRVEWFGAIGCSLSHLHVLSIARERGYKRIMILEDDFQFVVSREEFENNLRVFFDLKLNWEVCFLASNIIQKHELANDKYNVDIVVNAQTTCGYIINSVLFNEFIDLLEFSINKLHHTGKHWVYAIDMIWKVFQTSKKWVVFKQTIGKQSDIRGNTGHNT